MAPPSKKSARARSSARRLPDRKDILAFIEKSEGAVSRREIARAFGVKGEMRTELRMLLAELASEGLLEKGGKRRLTAPGTMPPVSVIDILSTDEEGDLVCAPAQWREDRPPPPILMPSRHAMRENPPVGVGDRVLARLSEGENGGFEAKPLKRLGKGGARTLAVYRRNKHGGTAEPVDKRARQDLIVERGDEGKAKDGDLVWVETKNQKGYGPKRARVREVAGRIDDQSSYSLIALANHAIPVGFSDEEEREAESAKAPGLKGREDLRALPLLTIDPADARDHDDAVCALPDDDPKNKGGWRAWVAIADVAHFATPGSALDRGALNRGNSVYFPDRVVPMLPERLSNGLCSLVDDADRPTLAVEMVFDRNGRKLSHRFTRGLMRSKATLAYETAQAISEGTEDGGALKPVIDHLFAAYRALQTAREHRNPLDLDMPERKIVFDEKGRMSGVKRRERLDAHRLIEEFMIQANVCAAETAEAARVPIIYRIHDGPDLEKLEALREYLESLGYSLAKGQVMTTKTLNGLIAAARERGDDDLIGEVVLRTQSQAVYDPDNIGHFGLNLRRYAHFTSPIRRYADLTVHRALIKAVKLGTDGQTAEEAAELKEIAKQISDYERRAMAAERETNDRFLAHFLEGQVGAEFDGRIVGVIRFGLFVRLAETGADGFCPVRALGFEYFHHDEARRCLIGDTTGLAYRLGQTVRIRLADATPLTGGLIFEMLSDPVEAPPAAKRGARSPGRKGAGGGKASAGKRARTSPGKHLARKGRRKATPQKGGAKRSKPPKPSKPKP